MPGDGIVSKPRFLITHGITIDALPEDVWPWLVQMGWHRGGWYTARWVDKMLFPANRASVTHVIDLYQDLHVGDFIPDGAPETECGFVVEELEAPRVLVLHSTSHLPLEWRRTGKASIDWTWVFSVVPIDSGDRTRFIFRWRAATKPWWLTASSWAVIVPADFIMEAVGVVKNEGHGDNRYDNEELCHISPHLERVVWCRSAPGKDARA